MSPEFVLGFTACGCLAVAVFFTRFWLASRDRFFVLLATAFAIFAVNRIVLGTLDEDNEARPVIYVFRLLAFLVILVAIIDKSRRAD